MKLRSCSSDQFSQGYPGLCWGRLLFWLLIWHFMSSGIVLEFDASHRAVVVLLGLGAILFLPTRKGATVEVVLATCHKCSFKLCLLFGSCGPTSLQQRQLGKNNNFGRATRVEITRWLCNTCRCISSSAMNRLGQRRKVFYQHDAA